jgi:ABC-2 type transport system ATP-binding protein
LLVALAHRPELLVLDEPSTGLDPIVRRDILTAIIRTIADEGRTVLFSPHLLEIDEPSPAYGLLTKLGSSQCCGF